MTTNIRYLPITLVWLQGALVSVIPEGEEYRKQLVDCIPADFIGQLYFQDIKLGDFHLGNPEGLRDISKCYRYEG